MKTLHRFAPAGHLLAPTRYCWKCHSLAWILGRNNESLRNNENGQTLWPVGQMKIYYNVINIKYDSNKSQFHTFAHQSSVKSTNAGIHSRRVTRRFRGIQIAFAMAPPIYIFVIGVHFMLCWALCFLFLHRKIHLLWPLYIDIKWTITAITNIAFNSFGLSSARLSAPITFRHISWYGCFPILIGWWRGSKPDTGRWLVLTSVLSTTRTRPSYWSSLVFQALIILNH